MLKRIADGINSTRSLYFPHNINYQRSDKHVVIIGGGFAGGSLAGILQDSCNVTIVDKKDYFENICAMYRASVEIGDSNFLNSNRMLHSDYASKATIMVGEVTGLTRDRVYITDRHGRENAIPCDCLVIATGSSFKRNFQSSENNPRLFSLLDGNEIQRSWELLRTASSVGVIGAGACGVELTKEIAEIFPAKTVHLFGSAQDVLPHMSNLAKSYARNALLTHRNIDFHLGRRVNTVHDSGLVETTHGNVPCDVVYQCNGFSPNTEFLNGLLPSEALDTNGSIRVDEYFRVAGTSHLFAVGDVTNIQEDKIAKTAMSHAMVAAHNIREYINGTFSYNIYQPKRQVPVCVMLGRTNAVLVNSDNQGGVQGGLMMAKKKQFISLSARLLPTFITASRFT